MATLSLRNLQKSYGRTAVIHGVSIDVADGEFIVIVGPSGCGKSTLLRMVAGLEAITAGDLFIGADRVNDREPMDRNIAMVFQNYALYPHMSVAENMGYALRIAGKPKAEIAARVAEAARMLQLEPYLARKPRELSGGQRQRVAMGRAIVRDPSVFLFDEPLSNLDAKLRVQMRLEIKGLQRKLGVTALYVTHDQVEAMTLADRMIVMNAGVAEQIGTPLEVYERPATVFAAQFIGSPAMNMLDGTGEGRQVRLANGVAVPVAVEAQGPVKLGLRPEHLTRDETGPLTMQLRMAEPLGANTLVHGTMEGVPGDVVASLPGVHREDDLPSVIRFSIPPEATHVFDAATERRI
ncbi:sn-glycerol-3-phosphate ABC transporter ATP-binding protein UgpC [Aliigemmobacter aestuarii]|uniref:sn-glycerol-3-phosphate ABC transporter ATP-binding protein UgpC n=1 Tax=Aliigemmobacter aestuarii TaxID=1445661 RepID=A0A4S3MP21_9RHOB|nr:sn-glycerol-3-phosphate ABC transporter ATP-binding protein UgpC [Gemmobacter aestuarii]THD83794.1 sn-glycerol-3-phosphate ABC transporter ATP-binding protein UgpC [Gemmobacter aestuarii]